MLEVKNISKSFLVGLNVFKKRPKIQALTDISFSVNEHESIAILGKNGSGKTTLLKILSGLISHDKGEIISSKEDLANKISIINSNYRSFFWRLTVEENLRFFCSFDDIDKDYYEKILNLTGLDNKLHSLFASLSYGQKKKLSIARALLKKSDILLMDEITSSVDIRAKKRILKFIKELRKKNLLKAIIFSTHDLSEVIELADKFIFIDNGKILKSGHVDGINSYKDLEKLFDEK